VQAPLTGPAADEGRAMVDAVRLVVAQANGLAGKVRVIVRPLDDGGVATATDPKRCAGNAGRAVADPGALAVIGTYELACSEQALEVLRPAGLLLVSPLNAADNLPGALRLAPTAGDQGTAAAQLANALGATRVAIVSRRTGAAVEFATALSSTAPTLGIDPIVDLDASATPIPVLVDEIRAGQVQVVALAGSPGRWADELLRALAALPKAVRPAVVAPQAFDTLAFLDGAGVAAEGVHVLSRLVPAEQLGGDARTFAGAYADLHGQPPPVAIYAADAARAVLEAVAGTTPSRAAVAKALLALPAHDGLLGRWAATATGGITPRRMAVLVVAGGTFRAERVISVAEPLPSSGEVK
jgi:ABC-type branched-subunit amino acid transport system substrate-binding protein